MMNAARKAPICNEKKCRKNGGCNHSENIATMKLQERVLHFMAFIIMIPISATASSIPPVFSGFKIYVLQKVTINDKNNLSLIYTGYAARKVRYDRYKGYVVGAWGSGYCGEPWSVTLNDIFYL
jgi:hypothetical protein